MELDDEVRRLIEEASLETLEEAIRIAKLHWAIDFQQRDYGFSNAEERQFQAWVQSQR